MTLRLYISAFHVDYKKPLEYKVNSFNIDSLPYNFFEIPKECEYEIIIKSDIKFFTKGAEPEEYRGEKLFLKNPTICTSDGSYWKNITLGKFVYPCRGTGGEYIFKDDVNSDQNFD